MKNPRAVDWTSRWTWLLGMASVLSTACADIWGFDDLRAGDASVDGGETGPDALTGEDVAVSDSGMVDSGSAESGMVSDAGCSVGTLSCNGQQPTICTGSGTWQNVGNPCSGSTPACLNGACVQCAPSSMQCSGNSVETCNSTDQWGSGVACSQPTPDCNLGACTCLESTCSGACVDEQTDNNNCGGCGIPCVGMCTEGQCDITLASNQIDPFAIAVDATNVYWTNSGSGVSDGAVMRCAITGCNNSPTTLASGQSFPQGIAVDATSVYWVVFGSGLSNGTVMSVPVGGGTPVTLASGQSQPLGIAALPLPLVPGMTATSVYWTNTAQNTTTGTVMKLALGSGTTTTLASAQNFPYAIAMDATSVYWTDYGGPPSYIDGAVMKMPLGGGAVTTLASGQNIPYRIAVDATSVYWTDESSGTVMKVPLAGGTPVTLAAGQNGPEGIAVDNTSVYWTNPGGQTLMKVPLGGGAPTTIATGTGTSAIAVDATNVYWTTFDTVMKIAK